MSDSSKCTSLFLFEQERSAEGGKQLTLPNNTHQLAERHWAPWALTWWVVEQQSQNPHLNQTLWWTGQPGDDTAGAGTTKNKCTKTKSGPPVSCETKGELYHLHRSTNLFQIEKFCIVSLMSNNRCIFSSFELLRTKQMWKEEVFQEDFCSDMMPLCSSGGLHPSSFI